MKLTIFFLCLFLYGCAAKKLAVDNADSLITYQVTKRVPLYSGQKEKLEKDIDAFLVKAKPVANDILPVIDEIDLNTADKLPAQYNKFESFYSKLALDFAGLMAKHLSTLDKKQQKDFFANLDDENRTLLKKEKEDRIDDVEERFKSFLGSINGPQKQLIREYEDYFHSRAKQRLDRRIALHKEFREIFKTDVSSESKEKSLHEAFAGYQKDALAGNKNLEILKKVIPTLSQEQKEHFRKEAQEVKDVLKYFLTVDY